MKIKSVRLHPVVVPRQYGTVIAMAGGKPRRTVATSYFLFAEVTTDNGRTGWGELSDLGPNDQPTDAAAYAAMLTAFLSGRSPWDVQRMHAEFREHFDVANSGLASAAQCALDAAMYDLAGQAAGRPVSDLLGGAIRREVTVSWVAFIREDVELIREEIKQKTSEGFTAFKLKVGIDIDLDERRLAVARETAGPRASIKLDANEGWSVADAPKHIRRLNKYNLSGVETPVPRKDVADIAAVRRQVEVPILEHVGTLEFALDLVKAEAVDVFNIATTASGGLWLPRQIVGIAQAAGLGVLLGSTVELGPGTAAQLHLAATVPNLTLPSDLIGPGMYKDDVLVKPLQYRAGKLDVPTGPGLGVAVDREKLKSLAPRK